ncbi:amino acid ABC transporter permease [Mailhella massiliensis]|uniref:Amino acid ABC transporter permease n=1 Tax=Mailhella massiliensis TaxID=1903261 RepID=A0A921ATZ6_9BACT|nr:amino acid ABC transporter permease [Mailhella massiliensis]HJD96315.1 amino acid ABC transporter permease [Mailhella massiliensis]
MPDLCVVFAGRERLKALWRPALLLALMLAFVWWIVDAASEQYRWQWYRVWRFIGVWEEGAFRPGALVEALYVTLRLTLASLALSLASGAVLAGMRLSASPVARALSFLVLGALRNTPLLMQLFMVYFVAAPVLGVGPFWAAVLSLGLFEGAYVAEIFRAGVLGVPKGQWEAALSLGMPVSLAAREVVVPQALRQSLPALAGQLVALVKDTSLVSAIAVADLTMRTRVIITDTFLSFEMWLLAAAVYLVLTSLVSIPARLLERKEQV